MSEQQNNNNKKKTEKLMTKDVSYPDPDDPELQLKLYRKREFYYHVPKERPDINNYTDMKEYRDEMSDKKNKLIDHQPPLANLINQSTPYKGLLVFHGLGIGKT